MADRNLTIPSEDGLYEAERNIARIILLLHVIPYLWINVNIHSYQIKLCHAKIELPRKRSNNFLVHNFNSPLHIYE